MSSSLEGLGQRKWKLSEGGGVVAKHEPDADPAGSPVGGSGDVGGAAVQQFAGPGDAPSSTTTTDLGGPKLSNVGVTLLFWGQAWGNAQNPSRQDVEADVASIMAGPYLRELDQYGVNPGWFIRSLHITANGLPDLTGTLEPPNPVGLSGVQTLITSLIDGGTLDEPDEEPGPRFYCVMLPPGVNYQQPAGRFLNGLHSFATWNDVELGDVDTDQRAHLAWVLYGSRAFISSVFSHELAEAVTDPEGTGIQVNPSNTVNWNEIGDACSSTGVLNGVTVQSYWSQRDQACIIPTDGPLLVAQTGFAVARTPTHLDVFWMRPDGAIGTQWWDGGPNLSWGDHQPFTVSGATAGLLGSKTTTPIVVPGAGGGDAPGAGGGAVVGVGPGDLVQGLTDPLVVPVPASQDVGEILDPIVLPTTGEISPDLSHHVPLPLVRTNQCQVGVVARMPNHLDVFWIGDDGAVWSQWWDATSGMNWSDHAPFTIAPAGSAQIGTGIAVVARNTNHLDVFWIGPNGDVWTQWWDGAPGLGWGNHAPFTITAPGMAVAGSAVAAVARQPNHLDVFWVGPDGAVWTQWWDAAAGLGWGNHGPFPVSGGLVAHSASGLAAVARMPRHLDLFWISANGAVWSQWWDGAQGMSWGDHQPFPITPAHAAHQGPGVAAVARTTNHLDVFYIGPDGAVASHWWDGGPNLSWGDHQPFPITSPGAAHMESPLAALARTSNHLDVFYIGPDGAVATQWWDGGPNLSWGDHQPFPITKPAAARVP